MFQQEGPEGLKLYEKETSIEMFPVQILRTPFYRTPPVAASENNENSTEQFQEYLKAYLDKCRSTFRTC